VLESIGPDVHPSQALVRVRCEQALILGARDASRRLQATPRQALCADTDGFSLPAVTAWLEKHGF